MSAGCAFITEDEYAHRMSAKAARECAFTNSYFADTDEDGFGNPDVIFEDCTAPEGTVDNADDCDDADPLAFPGAIRAVDEDGDGYGSTTQTVESCLVEAGMSASADDCDDTDPAVNPGAVEDCATDYDDDCSGRTNDEDAEGCIDWFADADEDGFAGGEAICMCESSSTHGSMDSEDCDDGNAAVYPDAPEICNDGLDNNCDETADGCGFAGETSAETAAYVFTGLVAGAKAGSDLVYAPDLTEDGVDDLLIGAFGDGALTVVSGAEAGAHTTDEFLRLTGASGQNLTRDIVLPGDVDGDGIEDLVLGAPSANFMGRNQAGAVNVYFGPLGDFTTLGTPDAQILGPHGNAYLGRNMGTIGDFDGDGVDDVLAGGFDIKNVANQKVGAAYLVRGPLESGELIDGDVSGAVDLVIYGETIYDHFGSSMTAMGDWSGDGLPDLIIAARDGSSGKGALYGFESGPLEEGGNVWSAGDADVLVDGLGSGSMTGDALRYTEDVDGDGLGDLLVGAPRRNLEGVQRGAAYLVSTLTSAGIGDIAAAEFRGSVDNAHFGSAVTALGSMDTTETQGIAIGAPAATSGAVYVFSGPFEGSIGQDAATGVVAGLNSGDSFGTALVGGVDFDEDGISDLLVGSPGADSSKGRVYVLLGGGM